MAFSKQLVTDSLRRFKSLRDNLLHEDEAFEHHLNRFVEFCRKNPLAQSVLAPLEERYKVDAQLWWKEACESAGRYVSKLPFPDDPSEELVLQYRLLELADSSDQWVPHFGFACGRHKVAEGISLFQTAVVRPLVDELGDRMAETANLATPEERALQAVPLNRVPKEHETRIFLSHKSVDKPLVLRYHRALKELGFSPWVDEEAMPAGTNLERGLFQGFEESCAAVFFITKSFVDEKYLAAEVDYAVRQKREKGSKFAIITLRYANSAPVPGLLTPYTYRDIENDLEGFYEVLRALPVELGPVRWRESVVE